MFQIKVYQFLAKDLLPVLFKAEEKRLSIRLRYA